MPMPAFLVWTTLVPSTVQEYISVRRGAECTSADAHFGRYESVELCEAACAAAFACRFFIFGVGNKSGHCWQEFTESANCSEGWQADDYDFYSMVLLPLPTLSCQPSDPRRQAPHTRLQTLGAPNYNPGCCQHQVRWSLVGSVRLHRGGECRSPDRMLGQFSEVHECAAMCARTHNCR